STVSRLLAWPRGSSEQAPHITYLCNHLIFADPVSTRKFLPEDDVLPAEEQPFPVAASPTTESPGYIPESDPEEDPEEDDEEDRSRTYPANRETTEDE
ncbi:hypothetical protein Tco_0430891, partial [Tanacetum coccineum]